MGGTTLASIFTQAIPRRVIGVQVAPPAPGGIANFTNIARAIQNVVTGIFQITTPLAILLIIGAGIYLMFDRNHSFQARLEKLYFLKNVLIGYAIIFAANFILTTLTQILQSGGINH